VKVEDVDTKALDHNFDAVKLRCLHAAKEYATNLKMGFGR